MIDHRNAYPELEDFMNASNVVLVCELESRAEQSKNGCLV